MQDLKQTDAYQKHYPTFLGMIARDHKDDNKGKENPFGDQILHLHLVNLLPRQSLTTTEVDKFIPRQPYLRSHDNHYDISTRQTADESNIQISNLYCAGYQSSYDVTNPPYLRSSVLFKIFPNVKKTLQHEVIVDSISNPTGAWIFQA